MELSGSTGSVTGSLADYRRTLVNRIVLQTVADLAQEKGITPESSRRWSRLVARAEKTASKFEKTLPEVPEVREIGVEDLFALARTVRIPILREEAEPAVEGPNSRG